MNDFNLLLIGAGISLVGSAIGQLTNIMFLRRKEVKFIKTSLKSELDAISGVVDKCQESFKNSTPSGQVNKKYFTELTENMEVFNEYKLRLYLLKSSIRNEIFIFYKILQSNIIEFAGKAGSIQPEQSDPQQQVIMNGLNDIKYKAETLKQKIKVSWWL